MKIALIGPVYPYRGGIAHYTQELDSVLRARSHQLLLISFKRQYPAFLYPGKTDKDPSPKENLPHAHYLLDPLFPWTWWHTFQTIANFQPDIIALQWWTTFWAIPYWTIGKHLHKKFPLIFMIHNVFPHEKRSWDAVLARLALAVGDSFIVHTQKEKLRLLQVVQTDNIHICLLPIFSRFSNEPLSRKEAKRQLDIPESRFLLLFFGIVRPYKGLMTLLYALKELSQQGYAPLLLICGEFWEDIDKYHQLIDSLQIDDLVQIDNRYIPDQEAHLIFSAADALVTPYTGGTQSAAAVQGLAYNLPVIASDLVATGLPSDNQKNILVFPTGDIQALVKQIEILLRRNNSEEPDSLVQANPGWKCLVDALERSALF